MCLELTADSGLLKIMKISVAGGMPKQFLDLKDVFSSGTITRIKISPENGRIVVALEVGKGEEVWKLEGVFND